MIELVKTYVAEDWAVLSSAPLPFLTAATVVGIGTWRIAKWHYAGRIDTLTEQRGTLEHRLQARDDEIKTLNAKLANAQDTQKKALPLDSDEIEQYDRILGKFNAPEVRLGEGIVVAKSLIATGDYYPRRPFLFRNFKLCLTACDAKSEIVMAGETRQEYGNPVCHIID